LYFPYCKQLKFQGNHPEYFEEIADQLAINPQEITSVYYPEQITPSIALRRFMLVALSAFFNLGLARLARKF
jgi:hypothetical protein